MFSRKVSIKDDVVENTMLANNFSNYKFSTVKNCNHALNGFVESIPPLKVINKKIYNYSSQNKFSDLRCYVYSQPSNDKIPYNFYAIVFVGDQECIKISREVYSSNWMVDVENILLQPDSLHFQKKLEVKGQPPCKADVDFIEFSTKAK